MYEERRETFSVKDILIQIFFVVLFVILLVWLFPTKGYMRKFFNDNINKTQTESKADASADNEKQNASETSIDRLAALYNQIFADNIERMKDAAVGYYTNERLPQKVGQSDKMTLAQMYEKHLVLKLIDKDGNYCSAEKSYVEITKYDEEYRMKVNLSCGSQEDYIMVYLGCYDYCKATGVCEKQTPVVNPSPKPSTSTTKKYICEYKKTTDGTWSYTPWSDWSKNKVTADSNTEVQTKVVEEKISEKTEKVQTGTKLQTYVAKQAVEKYVSRYIDKKYIKEYKDEQYVKEYKDEQYVSGYKTERVQTGTTKVQVGTQTVRKAYRVQSGTTTKYVKSDSGTTIPSNTSKYIYVKRGSRTSQSCSSCAVRTSYTWDVYEVVPVYKTEYKTETVPVYETKPVYATRKVPVYATRKVPVYATKKVAVYATRKVPVYATKKVPVYETRKVPVYGNVTYYRYRTKKYTGGTSDIKWSTCDPVDKNLTSQGYKLTGRKKAA